MDQIKNFTVVTLTRGYANGVTSVTLETGHGSRLPDPAAGEYNLVWFNATDYPGGIAVTDEGLVVDPKIEIVRVVAKSGDVLTIRRAEEGTTDNAHDLAERIYQLMMSATKKTYADLWPGGVNKSVQFNDEGQLGGNTSFSYDKVTQIMNLGNISLKSGAEKEIDIYNWNDDEGYERAYFKWDSNIFKIGTEKGGTGTARKLSLNSLASIDINAVGGSSLNLLSDSSTILSTTSGNIFFKPGGHYNFIILHGIGVDLYPGNEFYHSNVEGVNYERGYLRWSGNVWQIGTEKYGTGIARAIEIQALNTISINALGGAPLYLRSSSGMDFTSDVGYYYFRATVATAKILLENITGTNYERAYLKWDSDVFKIGTEKGGTGEVRPLEINSDSFVDISTNHQFYSSGTQITIESNNSAIYAHDYLLIENTNHKIYLDAKELQINDNVPLRFYNGSGAEGSEIIGVTDYSGTVPGTILIESSSEASLGAGDTRPVGIFNTFSNWYDGEFTATGVDSTHFYVIDIFAGNSTQGTWEMLMDYERAYLKWDSDVFKIGTEKGGTGQLRGIQIGAASPAYSLTLNVNTGTLYPSGGDNVQNLGYDFGGGVKSYFGTLYLGTSLQFDVGGYERFYNIAGTDYERAYLKWDSNLFRIGTEKGGTGTLRPIYIGDTATGMVTTLAGWLTQISASYQVGFAYAGGIDTRLDSSGFWTVHGISNTQKIGVEGFPWYQAWIKSYYSSNVLPYGIVHNITGFADYGSGRVQITSATHNLPVGTSNIVIAATANYNGSYVATKIDANSFYITHTWEGDDAGGTFTSDSDFERAYLKWDSNIFKIGTEKGGTGTLRDILISPGNKVQIGGSSIVSNIYGGFVADQIIIGGLRLWYGYLDAAWYTRVPQGLGDTFDLVNNMVHGNYMRFTYASPPSLAINLGTIFNPDFYGNKPSITLYNVTGTDYERAYLKWDSNTFKIGTEAGGTGTLRDIRIDTGGTLSEYANWLYLSSVGTINLYWASGGRGASFAYDYFNPQPPETISLGNYNATWKDIFQKGSLYNYNMNGTYAHIITAFADYGGGNVQVTSATHNLPVGTTLLIIAGTTNYNGGYNAVRIDANSFYIVHSWLGDDATGTFTTLNDYERAYFKWDTNIFKIGTEANGTGLYRNIEITGAWGRIYTGESPTQALYISIPTTAGGPTYYASAAFGVYETYFYTGRIRLTNDDVELYFGTTNPVMIKFDDNASLRLDGKLRVNAAEDTDFDTDQIISTGIGASFGIMIVRDDVDDIVGIFRVQNQTLIAMSADDTYSIVKDTASKYNVYWETDQFKVQNKVGNNKNTRVGFFGV